MRGAAALVAGALAAWPACKPATPPVATILYFNDAHQIMPVVDELGQRGGVARLKTVVDGIRRERPDAFVVLGGDLGGGRLFGGLYKGFPMVEAFNRLPLDLATFGQHDFDFGADVTRRLVRQSHFPWITTNLVGADERPFAGLPRHLVVDLGGLRVGFVGLTDAMDTTTRDGQVRQRDLLEAAREATAALVAEGADALVALTQTNLESNERLLLELPELTAVLTEERAEDRSLIHYVGARPIAAPCGNMGSLVRLDIARGQRGPLLNLRIYAVDEHVASDAALAALERRYVDRMEADLSEPVATLATALDAGLASDHATRWRETRIGNLIADAYRAHHGADVGLINGGGIRASIRAGTFTRRDALSALPFGNRVLRVELTGATLRRALEQGLTRVHAQGGGFLQVSGLRYAYDWSAPAGRRLLNVTHAGRPLKAEARYRVALPDYLLGGGDGFTAFAGQAAPTDRAEVDAEVLIAHVRRLGAQGPLTVPLDDRIRVHNYRTRH